MGVVITGEQVREIGLQSGNAYQPMSGGVAVCETGARGLYIQNSLQSCLLAQQTDACLLLTSSSGVPFETIL